MWSFEGMALVTLSQSSIWSPGDTFWFVPNLESSVWTKKIDWYLNQQISWSKKRVTKPIPEALREYLTFEPFEVDKKKLAKEPLFVVADGLLPTSAVIEMPKINDGSDWTSALLEKWKALGTPPIRIFLPDNISPTEFSKYWKSEGSDVKVRVHVVGSITHE